MHVFFKITTDVLPLGLGLELQLLLWRVWLELEKAQRNL